MKTRLLWLAAYAISAAASYVSTVRAGDIEHSCTTTWGEVIESWTSPSGITWEVWMNNGLPFPKFGPGYYSTACHSFTATEPGAKCIYDAVTVWNSCTIPGTSYPAGVLSFATPGSPTQASTQATGLDSKNTISMWPPTWTDSLGFHAYFDLIGGSIADTPVYITTSTGSILDADIYVNTYDPHNVQPWWTIIENHSGTYYATNDENYTSAPVFGYADLLGTLVHELGHVAGLGHALVEAPASSTGTDIPTMYLFAQAEPLTSLTASYHIFVTTQCDLDTFSVTGSIYGRSAGTLQNDDIIALARQYPSTGTHGLTNETGTISGTVYDPAGTTGVEGLVVCAIDANDPDLNRIHSLTYGGGAYTLVVPEGYYFVYTESVDQDPNGNDAPRFFFPSSGTPSYISPVQPSGWIPCITQPAQIQTEFYNSSDASSPEFQCTATQIHVTKGSTNGPYNIVTSQNNNMLGVGRLSSTGASPTYYSPHGTKLSFPLANIYAGTVEFKIRAGANYANGTYNLRFSFSRQTTAVGSQLDQIPSSSGSGLPTDILGASLDNNGRATVQVTLGSASRYDMIFVQADAMNSGQPKEFSNVSCVWVFQ